VNKPIRIWDIDAEEWREATQADFDRLSDLNWAWGEYRTAMKAAESEYVHFLAVIKGKYP
jgi:hypothetical protein